MKRVAHVLLFLLLIALHTSMAMMELCSWTLVAIGLAQMLQRRKTLPFVPWKPCLGLLICVLSGLILHPEGRGFYVQLGFLRWMIVLYFLTWHFRDQWNARFALQLTQLWSAIFLLSATYALLQAFTGIDWIRPNDHVVSFQNGIWRPVGFFSRSLAFAYSFGFSFLALILPASRLKPRIWFWLVLLLGTLTLVATEARGAWLGLLAAGLIYFSVAQRRFLGFFLCAVIVLGGAMELSHTDLHDKLFTLYTRSIDSSSQLRLDTWQAYYTMWKDHPFFGVGLLQGDLLVPTYFTRLGIHQGFVSNAHNVYLQWLAGAGVFALGFYLWLCAYFLWRAWVLRHTSAWGWSLFLAQIFLHVGALTENNFFTAVVNQMVVYNWAILLALDALQAEPRECQGEFVESSSYLQKK